MIHNKNRRIILPVILCVFLIFILSGQVLAEGSEDTSSGFDFPFIMGILLGGLLVLIINYKLFNNILLSSPPKKVSRDEGTKLLIKFTVNMRKTFSAYSGEFPSSEWDGVIDNIINLANKGGTIRLMAGQVVCIATEKTDTYSEFLKKIINAGIPLYKTIGNEILPHINECHFRVFDGQSSVFHYHYDAKTDIFYTQNNRSIGVEFEKSLTNYLRDAKQFDSDDAELKKECVVELKDTVQGLRYRKATTDEINGFKKYISGEIKKEGFKSYMINN